MVKLERIGRYRLAEVLGKGAMGVVWRAHDEVIGRDVALKTLRALDLIDDEEAEVKERFLREARAAGRLNHPNIVTVHDVGEDPETGLAFIAFELVTGRNLKDVIAEGHRPRPHQVARLVWEVASALEYAHGNGVIHRDIKPANLMLTSAGQIKITDFGIARLDSSTLTNDGQMIGTPSYMSPEQVIGKPIDGRSDLFSLGVLLYELLVGERPFRGKTLHQIATAILQVEPEPPSVSRPEIDPIWDEVLAKALAKKPEDRFATGKAFAEAVAAAARSGKREATDHGQTLAQATPVPIVEKAEPTPPPTPHYQPPTQPRPQPRPRTTASKPKIGGEELEQLPEISTAIDVTNETLRAVTRSAAIPVSPWQRSLAPSVIAAAIAAALLIGAGLDAFLWSRIDKGPFIGPRAETEATIRQARRDLEQVERLILAGRGTEAAALARQILDTSPSSGAARRLLADARRVQIEESLIRADGELADRLIGDAQRLFATGELEIAHLRLESALELDPENAVALELQIAFAELASEDEPEER